MIELGREKRQGIREICKGSGEALVRGAMEGAMGTVWAPDMQNIPYCLIVVGDFAYLLGLPPRGAGALDLKSQIYESASHACIYPQNEQWRDWLEEEFCAKLRTSARYSLRVGEDGFDPNVLKGYEKAIPQGFAVKRITQKLYRRLMKEEWSRDLCMGFENYEHFREHGFGFAAVKEGLAASGCVAYGAGGGMMEVQVKTRKEHRRQGLALACSAAFVLECLDKDRIPIWNATNQQSVELALKLGYVYEKGEQVYRLVEESEGESGSDRLTETIGRKREG